MDLTELSTPPYNLSLHINAGYSSIIYALGRRPKTSDHVLTIEDAYTLVDMAVAAPNVVTVPLHSNVPFVIGTTIDITQYGAGQTTIMPEGGVVIRSESGYTKIAARYAGVKLIKIADNEWYLLGRLSA